MLIIGDFYLRLSYDYRGLLYLIFLIGLVRFSNFSCYWWPNPFF